MDTIIRAAAIYAFLFIVFRISGKRSLSDITTFDFVLLLIIAETTQQALIGDDFSIITAVVLISTLFVIEISLTLLKQRSPSLDKFLEGEPVVLVENGRPLKERMDLERIDLDDILEAARRWRGLERIDQIKFAVLERDGNITVIPRTEARMSA
ncbi:MAG: hypothetical protein DIU63_09735 [Proteobacteria bacterium]|mgnify:CR=1|jgi:Predicted membrane protein|nr:MAG: hypothetical protein DIU63_09735 [Pseudomonadota bacterium]